MSADSSYGTAAERYTTLNGWAMREIAPWWLHPVGAAEAERTFAELNNTRRFISLFEFSAGLVHVEPKPASFQDAGFALRTEQYLTFFRRVAPLLRPGLHTTLCMSMDDQIPEGLGIPIFGFQKVHGSNCLLLPDLDFLLHDFYEGHSSDPLCYLDKRAQAVFVGATTGAMITPSVARSLSAPRLRAAAYFVGNPRVEFRLPRIVQCSEPEAEALLAEQPFCQGPIMPWHEQLQNRFVISMDGNGATCSRVAVVLASQSVLLKYDSPHQLYYFGGIQPWVHYVPVAEDGDIEGILNLEARDAKRFEQIAMAGRRFAASYLTRQAALWYTVALLNFYAECFAAD